jgi:chloramphenicol-sensitive protein RarD
MSSKTHLVAGFSSYLIWGFVPVLLKELSAYGDYEIIFYRMVVAALAIALAAPVSKTSRDIITLFRNSRANFFRTVALNLLGGALLAANWLSYVYVVNHVSINAASFAYLILPIATAFLAFFLLRERLTAAKWAGIAISAVSCYLVSHVDLTQVLYIGCITFSYSFYLISQRRNTLLPRKHSLVIQLLFGTLVMSLATPLHSTPAELGGHFFAVIAVLSLFFTVTPQLLNLFALNGMESSQLAFLIYVNPIISFWIGILFYSERLEPVAVTAYSLLAVAVVIFNWDLIVKAWQKTSGAVGRLAPEEIPVERS